MNRGKEERFVVCRIIIEKVIEWIPSGNGEARNDLMAIATIKHGDWSDSFNATTKEKFMRRLVEEVGKHLCWAKAETKKVRR